MVSLLWNLVLGSDSGTRLYVALLVSALFDDLPSLSRLLSEVAPCAKLVMIEQ